MAKSYMLIAALFGLGIASVSAAHAAPVAGVIAIEAPNHVEEVKKGGHKFKGHKSWKHSRHWNRGHGYGRYYGGPPPHARAYGRRAREFGYYRYW